MHIRSLKTMLFAYLRFIIAPAAPDRSHFHCTMTQWTPSNCGQYDTTGKKEVKDETILLAQMIMRKYIVV